MVSATKWTNYRLFYCPHSKRKVTFRASWRRVARPGALSFPLLDERDCDASVNPKCLAQNESGRKNFFRCPYVAEDLRVP